MDKNNKNDQESLSTPRPPQHQAHQPGVEKEMEPPAEAEKPTYQAAGKLNNKVALITGGDSGIGRAVAIAYAKEGADVAIIYLEEHEDAKETQNKVRAEGKNCLCIAGDIRSRDFCFQSVQKTLAEYGHIDILINNAAVQYPQENLENISQEQLEKTFQTNIYSFFYLTQACLPHFQEGASIINTASVVAYKGNPTLIDYAATKGAIVAFTRSLAIALAKRKIRVNGVAPGPVWTPLIPASFSAEKVAHFGEDVPMQHAGEPSEIAPAYVFLASDDASYIAGQFIHPNGGVIVNG